MFKRSRAALPFVLLMAAMLAGVIAAYWRRVDSGDLLFHLRTGRLIYDSGQIPNRDIFSSTSSAGLWIYFEWAWAMVLHLAFRLKEWTGINILTLALAVGTYGLALLRSRRAGAPWMESLFAVALVAITLLPVFQATPSMAILPLFLMGLLLSEARTYRWPMIFYPGVVALWANLHPGAIFALVVPVARAIFPGRVGPAIQFPIRRKFFVMVILASSLGFLITPHANRLVPALLEAFEIRVELAGVTAGEIFETPALLLRLLLAVMFIAVTLATRTLNGWSVITTLVLLVSGVAFSHDAINLLLIFLTAPKALALSNLLRSAWGTRRVRHLAASALVLACVAWGAITLLASGLSPDAWGTGVRKNVFPETAAGRLASVPLRASILNRPDDASFLLWRLWPNWKVTIDQRAGLYDAAFHDQYEKIWQGGAGWRGMLALWRVNAVLGDAEVLERYPSQNLFNELASSSEWTPVYWDRYNVLYLKSDIELSATNFVAFRHLKPGISWNSMQARIKTADEWRETAADIRRALLDDPGNPVALEFLRLAKLKLGEGD